MKYKLLCSDLDGTLLSAKSDVSEFTISQINKIKGHLRVILVSARMPSAMRYIQESLGITDQPLVCYNGALVLSGKKELTSILITMDLLREISTICSGLKTDLGLYYNDEWYVPISTQRVETEIKYTKTRPIFQPTIETLDNWEKRNVGAHKIMLMGTKASADELMPLLLEKFSSKLHLYRSNDTLIEIAPKSVSKLSAIKLLLKKNESLKDVIAFGDNYNDIDMLENVGCGVAVANARNEVKLIADYVTLKNTQDGVAHFIEEQLVI